MIPMEFMVDVKLRSTGEILIQSDHYKCEVPETHVSSDILINENVLHQYKNGFRLLMAYQPKFREKMSQVRSMVDVSIEIVRL